MRRSKEEFACPGASLTRSLLVLYTVSLLVGLVIALGGNVLILNVSLSSLPMFGLPIAFLCASVIAAALFGLTRLRLKPVYEWFRENGSKEQEQSALFRLFRWPYELLVVMSVLGCLFSIAAHVADKLRSGGAAGLAQADWPRLLGIIAGEQSLSVTLGIFMFTAVRRLLRPILLRVQPLPDRFTPHASIAQPLLITYAGTFLIALLSLFQLIVTAREAGKGVNLYVFAGAAFFYFTAGLLLFGFVTLQFQRELRELIRRIRELVSGGREGIGSRMPVISGDETGELALAFNELQARIGREYESFERELKLAYNVQEKLLPPGDLTIGSYRIAARCRQSRGVGGDFFDVLSLGPSRFAFMIGDVSGKGMPAALMMSALLLLFRAEVKRCGESAETLSRLNRQLCEAMGEEGSVSIGVGIVDMATDKIQYASAGHLSPYLVSAEGEAKPVESSSLPIGFDTDARYERTEFAMKAGDRLVLYTDGLIEAKDAAGTMYGFQGLEAELAEWGTSGDLSGFVDEWLHRLDRTFRYGGDDRTVVVLEQAAHLRKPSIAADSVSPGGFPPGPFVNREWSLHSRLGEERGVALELGAWIEEAWPEANVREDVQSAIAEAIVNAIEHGNNLREDARVAVVAQIGSRLTVCKVYDEGGGYFPHVARDEAEMEKKRESDDPRGWGLVLIDSLADYWSTGRDERGFYTELYFMRKTKAGLGL